MTTTEGVEETEVQEDGSVDHEGHEHEGDDHEGHDHASKWAKYAGIPISQDCLSKTFGIGEHIEGESVSFD